MAKATVKFKWDQKTMGDIELHFKQAVYTMATDIETEAKRCAPYLTGALSNSIRTLNLGSANIVEVVAGGVGYGRNVPYAYVRELGPNRDKSTVHYMRNAMNAIMSGDYMTKYFGGIAK